MLPKKKPLEDARKRLQEKLSNVEEQSDYICQFINDLVNKASNPAKKLLQERDRKKFFQKYSSVSQELEKCLDFLLLISDSVTTHEEEDTLGSNEDHPSSASETSDNASDNKASKQSVGRAEPKVPPPQGSEDKSVKAERTVAVCGQDKQESHLRNETVKVSKASRANRKAEYPALLHFRERTADSLPTMDISSAVSSGVAEQIIVTSQQKVSLASVGSEPENETLLDKPDKTVQPAHSNRKTFTEEVLSPMSKPPHSRNCSDSTRDLKQSEHSKPLNQRHTGHVVSQRVEKTFEKKRSLSSSSVLSDLVQDFQVSPAEASTSADGKTAKGVKLSSYPFINGEAIEVVVTEVISPWELWVQPIGTELDLLMEEMCMHYAKLAAAGYKGGLPRAPSVGEFCCAKFTQDETWYRAMVTKVDESKQGTLVQVYCVDDGNRESLGVSRLRPLEEKFSKLPCQALCCALSGVRPVPQTPPSKPFSGVVSAHWGQKAVEWLKSKVSGQTLLGYPTRTAASELIIIELYAISLNKERSREGHLENSLPGLEFNISEMMLRAGMAQRAVRGQGSPSGSSLSGSSEGSLSPNCSSVSVGSSVQEGTASSQQNTPCACSKDDSCTDHSSSRETAIRTSERYTKDVRLTAVKRHSSEEKRSVNDTNAKHKDVSLKELRGQHGQGLLGAGYSPAPDPGDYYMTEPPLIEGPVCLQMLMSHVVSVSEFYVHLVTPDAGLLDPMMDDLNSFYNSYPHSNGSSSEHSFQPQVGDYCCARFKEDSRWYRGLVTSLRCTVDENKGPQYESLEVEVFHVDFGSSEWVTVGDIRRLVPKFRTMPGQVVRCQLADIVPVVTDDMITPSQDSIPGEATAKDSVAPPEEKPVIEETPAQSTKPNADTETLPAETSRKKRGRRKKKQKLSSNDQKVVVQAAGTESCDSSELSEVEFVKHTPQEESKPSDENEPRSISSNKNAFPEKYLMPSPDRNVPTVNGPSADRNAHPWAPGTSELFEGLTDENRVLVGYMVPWNPWVYQQLFNPTAGGLEVDITYKKPTLSLNLYDTSGDEDIFINQVIVEVGLANFVENSDDPIAVDEGKIKLSLEDLESEASNMEQKECSAGVDEDHKRAVVNRLTSPLKDWDPMTDDFLSSKNSYAVDVDDFDIVFQGSQDLSRKVCRFYNSQSGCWKGDMCPNLHLNKGDKFRDLVEVFCDNVDSSVTLPDVGTWVAVRVTAVFHPGHFWIQFPYGTEPIEERILAARMGFENGDREGARQVEDLDSLMERMGRFYSSSVCQDPKRILPAVGELCVAKYSKDEKWYRARIICVREEELQVFFVDYGNSEWTPENNVKRMLPHFLHLPFQAVECFLGNVVPKQDAKQNGQKYEWSKDALDTFHSLTEDKILIAHILSKAWNQTIYIDLFDTDKEEVHINKVLVDKGFAVESEHTVNNPWNIEATVQFNPHKTIGLPG